MKLGNIESNDVIKGHAVASNNPNRIVRAGNVVNIYIRETITDFNNYVDIIEGLDSLEESDVVHMYICSGGGRIDIAEEIISAMKRTPAHCTTYPFFHNASAATAIALSGDNMIADPARTSFMIHGPSFGYRGTHGNVKTWSNSFPEILEKYISDVYRDFLSEEEIESLANNTEIYLFGDEINQRWEAKTAKANERALQQEGDNVLEVASELLGSYLTQYGDRAELQLPAGVKRSQLRIKETKIDE